MQNGQDLNRGVYTDVVTPMREDGHVDVEVFRFLLEWQKRDGVCGVVVAGVTGEGPTLTLEEKIQLWSVAKECSGEDFIIIASADSNDTRQVIELCEKAEECGLNLVSLTTPYFNRPTQAGIVDHFKTVASYTSASILLHNAPKNTGVELQHPTIEKILEVCSRVCALEDSSGDIRRTLTLRALLGDTRRLFSGDDLTYVPFMTQGGDGVVSVAANAVPSLFVEQFKAWERGDQPRVGESVRYMDAFLRLLEELPDPSAIKYTLHCLFENMTPVVRLPLLGVGDEVAARIRSTIERYVDVERG